jgi:hypothetical protein
MPRTAFALVALLIAACSGSPAATNGPSTSPVAGKGVEQGLIAYATDKGIGVLDPATGKGTIVAPYTPGVFNIGGPVWAPAPGVTHSVIYFTVHDVRPPERRTTSGVVPYDWIFRLDPFAGTIEPVAAQWDAQSNGPIGVVANSRYIAMTVGCCATYQVDSFDLTRASGPLKVLAKPPSQPAFFTEGIAPGDSGLVAVRNFGNGGWYWLNASAGVVNPFPLNLGQDDGPIAISADGTKVAVANLDHGAVVQGINSALPIGSPSATGTASPPASPVASASPAAAQKVNSKLHHPDGLSWSPDGKQLAMAVNGEVQLYNVPAPDGPPAKRYLTGQNVVAVSWSAALTGVEAGALKAAAGPQAMVDALLASTKLPTKADTPANRPLTKIYVWQFDSSKASPIEAITDATPAVLAKYPPLNAQVNFHHWVATDTWVMLGGCYRYRVVVTGSVAPVATTIGLASNTPCSAKASPT